jgi:hypothetical protein
MPNKITLELNPNQVEELVEKLPLEEKIRLVRRLERETWGKRIDKLFKKIDQRRRRYPISNKEIAQEIEIVRRKIYGSRGS